MKPFGNKIVYYNLNTSKINFWKVKNPVLNEEKSGVYRLTCDECGSVYIGETSHQFKIRLNEHLQAYLNKKPKLSAFAQHLLEEGYSPGCVSGKLLHVEPSFKRRLAPEKLEIYNHLSSNQCEVLNKFIPEGGLVEKLYPLSSDDSSMSDSLSLH